MSRNLPPITVNINQWAESMRRYLGLALDQLGFKDASASAGQDGVLLWDAVTGYPVVSKSGEWRQVAFEDGHAHPEVSGIAELDFGSGSKTAEVSITGLNLLLAASVVFCSMRIEDTDDHVVDDLLIDPIRLAIKSITSGVGFTIYGEMDNAPANGKYKVQWAVVI
jgi:hypothetical protein